MVELQPVYVSVHDYVAQAGAPVWAIIDGVNCKDMPRIVRQTKSACLFRAEVPEDAPHAPWIVRVDGNDAVIADLSDLPGEHHWGILFSSASPLGLLKAHFRKFTMLKTPANLEAPVYFRFFDPRVMLDSMQALEPEHLGWLLQPVQSLGLPLSPLLGVASGLHPLAERASYQSQVVQLMVTVSETNSPARAFSVTDEEYQRLTALQRDRSHRRLARSLRGQFPNRPDVEIVTAAAYAPERAARYGMMSQQQVDVFARCMLVLGEVFDEANMQARGILMQGNLLAWQKADDLVGLIDGQVQELLR